MKKIIFWGVITIVVLVTLQTCVKSPLEIVGDFFRDKRQDKLERTIEGSIERLAAELNGVKTDLKILDTKIKKLNKERGSGRFFSWFVLGRKMQNKENWKETMSN